MDVARVWQDCGEVLQELVARLNFAGCQEQALGVTARGDGTVLIDNEVALVGDSLLWLDRRAADSVSRFVGIAADKDSCTLPERVSQPASRALS